MKRHLVFFVIAAFSITGCAHTKKEWAATGGSRADGVVKLSFQFRPFEYPEASAQQGLELAKSKCLAWGYKNAEAFGGVIQTCNDQDSRGCNSWLVTAEYQCLGSLEK